MNFFKINKVVISIIIVIISLLSYLYSSNRYHYNNEICAIFSDGFFYYTYLPAAFIYHDWDLNFLNNIVSQSFLEEFDCYGFLKYPCGVAILQMPFFLITHSLTLIFKPDFANGYTVFYQIGIAFSSLFYFIIGVILNYKVLKKYVTDEQAQLITVAIIFGTGLFHYTVNEFSMSHIYSYFAISLFIYLMVNIKKYKFKKIKSKRIISSFIMGVSFGLIALIRNFNILILIVYFLYGVKNKKTLILKFRKFFNLYHLIPFVVGILLVMIPQFIYWYSKTGHFIIDSYHPDKYIPYKKIEYDNFGYLAEPNIIPQLFSLRCGLFVYYPILLYSIFGLFYLKKYLSDYLYCIPLFFTVTIYLLSSFCGWIGGLSFGMRFYVDYMAIFSILIAAFIKGIDNKNNMYLKKSVYILGSILVILTVIMQNLVMNRFCDSEGNIFNSPIPVSEYFINLIKNF